MEYFSAQVQQKDVGGRQQVGQELLLYLGVPGAIPDLEEDLGSLGKTIDALTGWVGSSNYRVSGGGGAAGPGTPSPAGPLIPGLRVRPGEPLGCARPRGTSPERGNPRTRGTRGGPASARRELGACFPPRSGFYIIGNNDRLGESLTRCLAIGIRIRTRRLIIN